MAIRRFGNSSITSAGGKSSKFWDQETSLGTFESIATATVDASGSSTITFTNIPQNYTHLQIRGTLRTNAGGNLIVTYNGDSGANYSYHALTAEGGGSVGASAGASTNEQVISRAAGISSTANIFSAYIIDILDYSNTTKNKTYKCLSGADKNGTGNIDLESGNWRSTAAITSIAFTRPTFQQYSQLSLYGIRGA